MCESEEKYNYKHIMHTYRRRDRADEGEREEGRRERRENMKYSSPQNPFIHIIEIFLQENLYYFHFTQGEMEADSEKHWKPDLINFTSPI